MLTWRLVHLLNLLTEREREVIIDHVLGNRTLAEVAAMHGVTKSAVSQSKQSALTKMRAALLDDREAAA